MRTHEQIVIRSQDLLNEDGCGLAHQELGRCGYLRHAADKAFKPMAPAGDDALVDICWQSMSAVRRGGHGVDDGETRATTVGEADRSIELRMDGGRRIHVNDNALELLHTGHSVADDKGQTESLLDEAQDKRNTHASWLRRAGFEDAVRRNANSCVGGGFWWRLFRLSPGEKRRRNWPRCPRATSPRRRLFRRDAIRVWEEGVGLALCRRESHRSVRAHRLGS